MGVARDELAAFDTDLLREADGLAETARAHQSLVRDLPGVDNIVYEWRKRGQGAVVHRSSAVYVLALPEEVWQEFTDRLDLDRETAVALCRLHDRQARRLIEADEPETDYFGSHKPMVLTRP